MIDTVIFDMDGVIIDSEPIHKKLEWEFFQQLGLHLTQEEFQSFTGQSGKNIFSYLKNKYKLSQSVEWMEQKSTERFLNHLKSNPKMSPIDGTTALIEGLKAQNIQLILASSATMSNIEAVMDMFDFHHFFPIKLSGADLEHSKPHPEIFLKAAQLGQTSPDQCIVIEDSSNGVKAAKAANMKCVGFQNPNSGNQDIKMADLIVHSMTELNPQVVLSL